mmetsp:Transcript_24140/g.36686  ORF Transcript_24140/g.36686 Transcript_24140/m.36686 type:complete len:253 (+) Transcript_24140:43-801(+)
MTMSATTATDEPTQQISETMENECIITELNESATAPQPPPQPTPPTKVSYRPKASSLPTSLVRTIQITDHDDNDGQNTTNTNTIPTTIILQIFSDRIFLSITQLNGKMGSLLVCNVEESIIDNSTTYHVSTLLGTGTSRGGGGGGGGGSNAEREVSFREVFVRRLAERITKHARVMAGLSEETILGGAEDGRGVIPPLVVGLGLKRSKGNKGGGMVMTVDNFNVVVDAAIGLYEEGWRICHCGGLVGMEGPD